MNARAARERRDRRRRIRGLESLAVAAPRISQPTQSNLDGGTGGERRLHLRMLSFTPRCMQRHFRRVPGVNDAVAYMAAHGSTPRHFPWLLPFSLRRLDSLLPINDLGKRRAEAAEKPIEFDLSFTGPRNGPIPPSGTKTARPLTRDESLLPFPRMPLRALPSRNTGSKWRNRR